MTAMRKPSARIVLAMGRASQPKWTWMWVWGVRATPGCVEGEEYVVHRLGGEFWILWEGMGWGLTRLSW